MPVVLAAALLSASEAAGGSTSLRPSEQYQEIIVTGERREEPLQETASSVVVFEGEEIGRRPTIDRLGELLAEIPNVGPETGSRGVTIRGQDSTGVLRDLAAFISGTRPRVALQVDGRPLTYFEYVFGSMSVWDLDQIEVFRSPQSTTQGRNSAAGAIFINTRDPTYAWHGRLRFLAGEGDARQASAMMNGSLIDDQLAVRITGDIRSSRPASNIGDVFTGIDPDHDDFAVFRAKFLAEPTALPWLRMETTYVRSTSERPQIAGVRPPFQERRDPNPTYGVFKHKVNTLTTIADLSLPGGYTNRTSISFGDANVERFALPGLGEAQVQSRDRSLETVFRTNQEQPLRWLVGINYLSLDLEQQIDVSRLAGRGQFDDDQHSLGIFGEAALDISAVTWTLALRYQWDSQDRTGAVGRFPLTFDRSYEAWLPRLAAAWRPVPQVTLGLQVQRASTPGGISIDLGTGRNDVFKPETSWSYEGFARARLANGRVRLAGNLFYTDIDDAQRPQIRNVDLPGGGTTTLITLSNAPHARTIGLEAEAVWSASPRLTLQGGLGLLETKILQTASSTDPILSKEFERSPDLSASMGVTWRPATGLNVGFRLRHTSGYFSDDANTPEFRIPAYTQVDLEGGYELGPFTIFAYARNLFDNFTLLQQTSSLAAAVGRGREAGLGVQSEF